MAKRTGLERVEILKLARMDLYRMAVGPAKTSI